MKTAHLILAGLAIAVVWASISCTALAQKDVRLVPADTGGTDNDPVSIGIGTKYIILGTPGSAQDFATIFEGEGDKWKQTAHLTGDGGAFGQAVAITDIRGRSNTAFAIVGAPTHDGAGEARVFALSGRDWNPQARLRASDAADGDAFGLTATPPSWVRRKMTMRAATPGRFMSLIVSARAGTNKRNLWRRMPHPPLDSVKPSPYLAIPLS